jgi:putative transposase
MSRPGNVWDNAAMESFFSSLKTERVNSKVYRKLDHARADVFHYVERFLNQPRRDSEIPLSQPAEPLILVGIGALYQEQEVNPSAFITSE